jgi:hypothetical protein
MAGTIKITPFLLFLILLLVLVVAVLFGNWIKTNLTWNSSKEGFVSFQNAAKPIEYVSIPQYSRTNTPIKVYDNVFFDKINANLIEVDSTAFQGYNDVTGNTISKITVALRDGITKVDYPIVNISDASNTTIQDVEKSKIPSIITTYNSWTYKTTGANANTSTILYMPWKNDTYIHVIDMASSTHKHVETMSITSSVKDAQLNQTVDITGFVQDSDPLNNTFVVDTAYDASKNVYQLTKNIKVDLSNGCVIVQGTTGTTGTTGTDPSNNAQNAIIYDSYGTVITSKPTSIPSTDFKPWIVTDNAGQNMVLYMQNGTNRMISIINFGDSSKTKYNIANVCRFNETGLDLGTTAGPQQVPLGPMPPQPEVTKDSIISEYYKWYWYWKTTGKPNSDSYSDDYLLKTQIVPPVCPAAAPCPSCDVKQGPCQSCGGQGGSGTQSSSGSTMITPNNPVLQDSRSVATQQSVQSVATQQSVQSVATQQSTQSAATQQSTQSAATQQSTQSVATDKTDKIQAKGPISHAIVSSGNIAEVAVGTAGSVAEKTINALGDVTEKALDTAGNIIKSTGITKLAQIPNVQGQNQVQSQQYTYGAQENPLLQMRPAQLQSQAVQGPTLPQTQQTQGTNSSTVDSYSYYGMLPSKSGNFMPVTADFSNFSK